jgi:hypothetical protein
MRTTHAVVKNIGTKNKGHCAVKDRSHEEKGTICMKIQEISVWSQTYCEEQYEDIDPSMKIQYRSP